MSKRFYLIKKATLLLAAGFILLPIATYAAGDGSAEILTAATHAGFASKATTVTMVHTHLHHTLNCLVGPMGKGFDAKEENPCARTGSGAIPDTTNAVQKKVLQAAVTETENGITATDLAASQKIAAEVSTMLRGVK